MHEKSVVDGSSGRGLRGSEKTFCQFVESSWVASLFRGSTFWRAVGASWKPLRRLWGDLLGPLGGLRGLILALLTALGAPGPLLGLSQAAPWALLGGLGAPLGRSWRLMGLSWTRRLFGGPWGFWVALGRAQWVPGGSWVALASSLGGPASPQLRTARDPVRVHCIDMRPYIYELK